MSRDAKGSGLVTGVSSGIGAINADRQAKRGNEPHSEGAQVRASANRGRQDRQRNQPQGRVDRRRPGKVHDDSDESVSPLPVKIVSARDLAEDIHRSGIQRGMRVLDLGCGVGDVSLRIAKLVGPTGLVVGVDESAEDIDTAERRATVAGQCYWTRFVTADLKTFVPRGRFDVVVVHRALPLERERATLLRLTTWLHPDGVIMVMAGKPAGSADNRSLIGGK